jgi:hypothetical protein
MFGGRRSIEVVLSTIDGRRTNGLLWVKIVNSKLLQFLGIG